MKKIAFITHHEHSMIGGVETYNRVLYNHWLPKNEITEFPIFKTNEENRKQNLINGISIDKILCENNGNSFLGKTTYENSKMKKIYAEYDIVILSVINFPKKWVGHKKSILVQHHNLDYYSFIYKFKLNKIDPIGFFFGSLLFNIGTLSNGFKYASNAVFYSEETSRKIKGISNYIPLGPFYYNDMMLGDGFEGSFTWMARLDKQKNVGDAINIANANSKVNIYGVGKELKLINKRLHNKEQYKGLMKFENRIELLKRSKTFLITSKIEGFTFTAAEALSVGVPVIMYDSFDGARFYDRCDSVYLVKKGDWNAINNKINEIDNLSIEQYNNIQIKALEFARKNLSTEMFLQKWDDLIAKK